MEPQDFVKSTIKEETLGPTRKKVLKRKRAKSENEPIVESRSGNSAKQNPPSEALNISGGAARDKYQKYGKDKQWKLDKIPHYLLPSFNITNFTDINHVRSLPLLGISLPHSAFVSSTQPNNIDLCHRRTIALNGYIFRLKSVRTAYLSTKKKCKQVRKDEKKGIFNSTLIDFAKKKDNNPDKYFARDYDFYYTSGNLRVNQNTNHILHASGIYMNKLTLSSLKVSSGIPNIYGIANLNLGAANKNESEIFEVDFATKSDDLSFFVRRKYCISMHEYVNDKFNLLKLFRSKNVPLISFAQDKVNTNTLAISNLEHCVRIYDLEKGIPKQILKPMHGELVKPKFCWNMIRSWSSHVYLYAACRKLNIIDTRLPESEWRSNYCGFDAETYCSSFCSLALSKFENLFYVGSNHKVYCVDYRFMGKNIENKETAVSRWTHQMSSYPLMMAASCHEDCEYISFQSPLSADLRVCENMRSLAESVMDKSESIKRPRTECRPEYEYKSPCLPYMPESLESVYHEAQKHGNCIKPDAGIANRIKACNTGLDFVGDSSNPYILTATSNGDIFARHMYKADDDDNDDKFSSAAKVMSHFESNIFRSVRKSPLQVTRVCDLSGINKVFRCPALSDINLAEDTFNIPQKRKYMGRWQKSIGTLYKYKDALVNDLLSIWDVERDVDDEKEFYISALANTSVTDTKSLVSGWLENNPDIAHSTMLNMTSIPMHVFNTSSAILDTSIDTTQIKNESKVSLDLTMHTPANAKASKKKPRYIKGF